jgi:hypothetical protein
VPNALGPLLDSCPVAVRPLTCPDTAEAAPVLSVPDVEKFPDVMDALPRTIVFECVWPSEQTARQANWIDSTDVGVTVKEIGRPWLVVPTKSRGKDVTRAEEAAGDEPTVFVTVLVDPPQPATVRIRSSNAATIPAPDVRRVLSALGARPRSSIGSSIDPGIDLPQPLLEQRRCPGASRIRSLLRCRFRFGGSRGSWSAGRPAPSQSGSRSRIFRGFPSAPERTRTSTDQSVHKALNPVRTA